MKKFSTYLLEEKNTHMEHLEDAVLNAGVKGTRDAINLLRSLRDMLAGHSDKSVNVTVKWDGAPAVFAGIDPEDGKFFVAKKGLFNKTPKMYKTNADVDADTSGDLAAKLKLALQYLPELGITQGVYQGDFLYAKSDLKTEKIDGESMLTFHPNTIVYAVPVLSDLARTIRASKIGIVWHTTYTGTSIQDMKANFGQEIASKFRQSKNVWSVDATFQDVSGSATFTQKETQQITSLLSNAGKLFRQLDAKTLNGISDNPELLQKVKTHYNTKVRDGARITNVRNHVRDLVNYITSFYAKEEEKRKSEKGKIAQRTKRDEILKFFSNANVRNLQNIFLMMNYIIEAKEIIIAKMDQASNVGTFLKTADGFRVTSPEGYVGIDRAGSALKLVNRMEFSKSNFDPNIIKGWQR
jgi:hypothetical protein